MNAKLRLGFAGLVHDHVWDLAPQWRDQGVDFVAAADPNVLLLDRIRAEFDVARTYESCQAMLESEELDVLQISTTNAAHADVVEMAAEAGVHCLVEKPMAATLGQADRMVKAAKAAGVKIMVNWPINWQPVYREMRVLAASGAIGRILQVKHRGGHSGPRKIGVSDYFADWLYSANLNGAGAFMDYSGYGVSIVLDYLNGPTAVYAHSANLAQDFHCVDDNSVMILKFEREIALVESTWTEQLRVPWNTVVNGEEGTLLADYRSHELVVLSHAHPEGNSIKCEPMPEGHGNAPEYFVRCLLSDSPIDDHSGINRGRSIQEILQAGLISIAENREVALPLS